MILMKDIVREGHPALREVAKEVTFPLTEEEKQLGRDMLTFFKKTVKTKRLLKSMVFVEALA